MKLKDFGKLLLVFLIFISSVVFSMDFMVRYESSNLIISATDAKALNNVDCLLVLGAGIKDDKPSKMLQERLDMAIDLYKLGVSNKIIVSGDHGRANHDEVNVMKKYLIEAGIPSSAVFMDHAGFSTYDSVKRIKDIFSVKNVVIVTQKYHLYRSLYIASKLDLNVHGVDATKQTFFGQTKRELREVLARAKDLVKVKLEAKPTVGGEKIDIFSDGNNTNDNYILIKDIEKDTEKYIINIADIQRFEKIIDTSEYVDFKTYGISGYTLIINGFVYGLEVYDDEVIIKNKTGDKLLTNEDANFVISLVS